MSRVESSHESVPALSTRFRLKLENNMETNEKVQIVSAPVYLVILKVLDKAGYCKKMYTIDC